ncbi:MAG TPA: hypothetical protein VGA98_11435, partial [Allosphingosinicella sp.]
AARGSDASTLRRSRLPAARRADELHLCVDEAQVGVGKIGSCLVVEGRKRRESMRSNSGGGKSSNNTGNPTLDEHEAAKGRSGAAIHGDKKVGGSPDRTTPRDKQSS